MQVGWSRYLEHYLTALVFGLGPIIVFVGILHLMMAAIQRIVIGKIEWSYQYYALPFTCLGVMTGLVTGASRTAAVGSVMPAALALISALLAHFFAKEANATSRYVLPVAIVLVTLGLALGATFGASMRLAAEAIDRDREKERIRFEKVQLPLELKKVERELAKQGAN
jgi:hypothetical protein